MLGAVQSASQGAEVVVFLAPNECSQCPFARCGGDCCMILSIDWELRSSIRKEGQTEILMKHVEGQEVFRVQFTSVEL